MLMLKRNHTVQARPVTSGRAEPPVRPETGTDSQVRAVSSTRAGECEVRTGIDQILSMRVGCWRAPVYINDGAAR